MRFGAFRSVTSILARTHNSQAPHTAMSALSASLATAAAAATAAGASATHSHTSGFGTHHTLETLRFDNLALRALPVEKSDPANITPRQVHGACFSRVIPTPVDNPALVCASTEALSLIDLSPDQIERPEFAEYFSGNRILPGAEPSAHCYCGHQFGYFSGQLGDGATMYLGEIVNEQGERWEIQFKGAGKTPYSRQGDGRKVLRSSIREFLCSEAMYHLGVPTTRAGTVVTSDTEVVRDIFYNGNPIMEKATIILRIAPTFLRFGSFEIVKGRDPETDRIGPSAGRFDITKTLLDYTISTFYPEIPVDADDKYHQFYREIVLRTARLAAWWQSVGFCHGVLNTDNMSIVGVTIDYGPFGFMERFDSGFICNGSDDSGRYDYQSQPPICKWNLGKLGEAIASQLPLQDSRPILELFDAEFERSYLEKMRRKIGILFTTEDDDIELIDSLLETMQETAADFTNTFRLLSKMQGVPAETGFDILREQLYPVSTLLASNKPRFNPHQLQYIMSIPGLAQSIGLSREIYEAEMRKVQKYTELKGMSEEGKLVADKELWTAWLTKYQARLERDNAKAEVEDVTVARTEAMNSVNPSFVLRNHIAQGAIARAEDGDFEGVRQLLDELREPFKERLDLKRGPEGRLVVT